MRPAAALLLACLSLAPIACGRYGPPVRAPRPGPVPAAEPAPVAVPEQVLDTPDEELSAPSAEP